MLAVKVGRLEDLGYPPAPSPPRRASRAAYGYEYGYAYQGLWPLCLLLCNYVLNGGQRLWPPLET